MKEEYGILALDSVYTDELGYYEIIADSGIYDVSFSHQDYRDTLITEIQVMRRDTTTLNVVMEEIESVPSLSDWGMLFMGLLMLVAATIAAVRTRKAVLNKTG